MARILADKHHYSEYDHKYFYEKRYEQNIIPHLRRVFSDYFIYRFNPIIIDQYDLETKKTPDVIMIRKDYEDWIIVEIEKKNHPLTHVKEQVLAFQNGKYDELKFLEYSKIFLKNKTQLSSRRFFNLIKKKNPIVLVIVNSYKIKWMKEFEKIDVKYMVFELYKNQDFAFRIDGKLPYIYDHKSICEFVPESTQLLKISNSNFIAGKRKIKLFFSDRYTEWKIKKIKNELYLEPCDQHTMDITAEYKIFKKDNNRFFLEKN